MEVPKNERKKLAIVWDPKSPASLLVPTVKRSSSDGSISVIQWDTFLSHDGVGCNPHETVALMKLLDARDQYSVENPARGRKLRKDLHHQLKTRLDQSKAYRAALSECLASWEEELYENADPSPSPSEFESIEMLKVVYAVTHLSEIFILQTSDYVSADASERRRILALDGALTADTVRYLRHHHLPDVYSACADPKTIETLLDSSQPEHCGDGNLYWKLLRSLVLRGCLDQAWALLSRHSACRRCSEESSLALVDEYHGATLDQDREAFIMMRAILLSAPLPAGRSADFDAALNQEDDLEEEMQEDMTPLIADIQRTDYKLWEVETAPGNTAAKSYRGGLGYEYNHRTAQFAHDTWKRAVGGASTHMASFLRRLPELATILKIMTGDFTTVAFESWHEALCAELLYVHPHLKPSALPMRTRRAMERFGVVQPKGFDDILLKIMDGDAGTAIQSILSDLGGTSGAALPASMSSLLCSLLTKAIDPTSHAVHSLMQTEILLSASEAILASHAAGRSDVGVRLSTRLLLPSVTPSGDTRVAAWLAETLSHHAPHSDSECKQLIDLCKPPIHRKSLRVLDGCICMILSRYHHYLRECRYGDAVHWLIRGMELEAACFKSKDEIEVSLEVLLASGSCARILAISCLTTSRSLLASLMSESATSSLGYDFAKASEMMESVKSDEARGVVERMPEYEVLSHLSSIVQASVKGGESSDKTVAYHVVRCLDDTMQEDGTVSSPAHPSLYWDILLLANKILNHDEKAHNCANSQEKFSRVSFDADGIQALMRTFAKVTIGRAEEKVTHTEAESSSRKHANQAVVETLRLSLANGLMRAFVVENAKLKPAKEEGKTTNRLEGAFSTKLSIYSESDQEIIVRSMLDDF